MTRIPAGKIFFLSAVEIFALSPQVAYGHDAYDSIGAAFFPLILIPLTIINISIASYILEENHVTFGWRVVLCISVLLLSLAGLIGGWILMLVIFLVLKFRNRITKTYDS